jgi:hypothetical protein
MKLIIMTRSKMIFTTGLAMFAMFFGSGNLVFPLNLGVISGEDYIVSVLGFMLTGVFMPFVGLLSVMLYNGSRSKFFGLLGKKTSFVNYNGNIAFTWSFWCNTKMCCCSLWSNGRSYIQIFLYSLFSAVFSVVMLYSHLGKE